MTGFKDLSYAQKTIIIAAWMIAPSTLLSLYLFLQSAKNSPSISVDEQIDGVLTLKAHIECQNKQTKKMEPVIVVTRDSVMSKLKDPHCHWLPNP